MKVIQLPPNAEREILFFRTIDPVRNEHVNGHLLYILMSKQIDEEKFYKIFPNSKKITQAEFDILHDREEFVQVVPVGDDDIIDEYFKEEDEPKKAIVKQTGFKEYIKQMMRKVRKGVR